MEICTCSIASLKRGGGTCLLRLPEHSWAAVGPAQAWDSAASENEKRTQEMLCLCQCEGPDLLAGPFLEKGLSDTTLCVLFLRESGKPRLPDKGLSSC